MNLNHASNLILQVKVWQIPNGGLLSNLSEWQVDLHGHGRRVTYIEWHPTADNIILSAGLDYKVMFLLYMAK
jgi:coronin-2